MERFGYIILGALLVFILLTVCATIEDIIEKKKRIKELEVMTTTIKRTRKQKKEGK